MVRYKKNRAGAEYQEATQYEVKQELKYWRWNLPSNMKRFTADVNMQLKTSAGDPNYNLEDAVDYIANGWSLGKTE